MTLVANRSPWPPTNGATIRQWHILRALKRRGHAVDVFAFASPEEADESQRRVREVADTAVVLPHRRATARFGAAAAVLRGDPLTVGWYRDPSMAAAVRLQEARAAADAAVVHSSNVSAYVAPRLRRRAVMDMADADSAKFADYARESTLPMSLVHALEARRLRRWEARAIDEFAATTFVAERELAALGGLEAERAAGRVHVITNGVDVEHFLPGDPSTIDPQRLPAGERRFFSPGGPRLVFTGVMDYRPNAQAAVFFAQEVLPRIRAEVADARFLVVGARPAPEVRALERLPGVEVTGFVDDARPYFHSADVYVLPLRIARGVQNKALEAMACGCAVVSTRAVAEGLRVAGAAALDGRELLVADRADDFARHVSRLLADAPLRRRLGEQARRFVAAHFAWEPLMDRIVDLVEAHAVAGVPGGAAQAASRGLAHRYSA